MLAGGCGLALLLTTILVLVFGRETPPPPAAVEPTDDVDDDRPTLSADQLRLNQAVTRGLDYLRRQILEPEDVYYLNDPGAGSTLGVRALAGLTLLECGAPASDPAVRAVTDEVRRRAGEVGFTYSLCLAILFLDRLNAPPAKKADPQDVRLIQDLALRLVAAQNDKGGWGYQTPVLAPADRDQVWTALKDKTFVPGRGTGYDDNSINQFATLALWVARKHGVPTGPSLGLVEHRYRTNQNPDGSWGYRPDPAFNNLKDATTCAGLIGLAVGQARDDGPKAKTAGRRVQDDPAVKNGLAFLGQALARKRAALDEIESRKRSRHAAQLLALYKQWQQEPERREAIEEEIRALDKAEWLRGTYLDADAWGDLYFLWSVERVGVIFDQKTIGGVDWYRLGRTTILARQRADGCWRDRFPGVPDTCFALLFLKRVNVVKDLTDKLRDLAALAARGARPAPAPARKD
jgi:hypothetical protein